jgi:hypothetical protein
MLTLTRAAEISSSVTAFGRQMIEQTKKVRSFRFARRVLLCAVP